jgi:hypothetical protein
LVLWSVVSLAVAVPPAWGQVTTGVIAGSVKDPRRAP